MRGNTSNLQNNGNQNPGTPPGQNMFDPVATEDPFDKLCGVYYGSSMATIQGRVLFGGCTKASSQDACDQGGFFVRSFLDPSDINCDERCEPNTCRGADIIITAQSNGVSWSSASSTTTMGMVEITVTNGESKDGTKPCGGGGDNLPIPYDCEATVRGGATSFSCLSQEIPGPFGPIPAGVLRADATLSQSGVLNWQASALNPPEGTPAPSNGELQQQPGDYLKSGNIMGKKFEDMGDCHAHSAGSMGAVTLGVSDQMMEEMCSGYGR